MDALLEIVTHHQPEPERVERIEIAASVLTIGMDALSRPYLRGPDSDPVTLNFSVPYNAAAALIDGELTPRQFSPDRIRNERVWELASRVQLQHDPEWTRRLRQNSVITLAGGSAEDPDLADADLSRFEMSFAATVALVLEGGGRFERAQAVPLGAAGCLGLAPAAACASRSTASATPSRIAATTNSAAASSTSRPPSSARQRGA